MDENEWNRVMDVNLEATFFIIKAVLPSVLARNYGRVIHISSMVGKKAILNSHTTALRNLP
ncbi:SDR family NAD(P)-dependent oxidoreductase [Pseudomonas yamanorum]|uniref:SDR family NAD(P)-dependent oxidoreductase n=1 Tax=Pseudomonas yamanorum TaxID=515393 RepID=A0A7Y8K683_9PSED|nr:SDR family NAD(P)-dependent oxidoreductase [Pseudomonas yamanorum]